MKKSYDYFKMLKNLSESVSVIYAKILLNKDFSSDRIRFFAEKSELINNLQNEFITPLERGDIFFLAESLAEELCSVFSLKEYFTFINKFNREELEKMNSHFEAQNHIFSQLSDYRSNLRLFEQCSEEIKSLNTEKKSVEKRVLEALGCMREQFLLRYVSYSAYLDLNRKIYKTILQIERILIDNS